MPSNSAPWLDIAHHFGGGPYDIGPGVVYGESIVALRSLAARDRYSSRFWISFSS